ncbi:RNA polymerase sigma factor [Actinokineospora cianjurensis]|uniref:RNA polymerase ECF family sigma subunit n=1 Tax=Actinokineospora cianjurensis TaxID=585224 RepID=A0A421BCK6_9PSEU|nr:sigma-70 family RNA polymerase sigma factor [Actinokineospora cianjurensis]RLK62077.1 RNA polymerase ECF family sigma subunit [Actinokineospora cianjurensis]
MSEVAEDLLRVLAPQVLAALVRRNGWVDGAEDAVQEALVAAATQWPAEGVPDNPRAWLVTVASRRLVDHLRADASRRRREEQDLVARTPVQVDHAAYDDSLELLFLCCHPELSPSSRIALTLRAVGGLSTAQIAAAFLVPEATMAQRISRARQTVRDVGLGAAGPDRLDAVLHVLYLVFTEGHTSTDGTDLTATALSDEAIRLTRWLRALLPDDTEVAGLLALMLLTDSHRPARLRAGALVPLAEQDRSLWDRAAITEGVDLITGALTAGRIGPYQLQAAIAAVHSEAATAADTDWPQIAGLYQLLDRVAPSPVVTLNRAVAVGMTSGPEAGLALLATLTADKRMTRNHRLYATRAHLLDLAGDTEAARADYREAAKRATSAVERRHLTVRAAGLSGL